MDVRFSTTTLQKCYTDHKAAVRAWGAAVARRYVQRVDLLKAAPSAEALYQHKAVRFHPLKGSLAGTYALNLDGFHRLLVRFENEAMTIVTVEEVSKHYGD